MDIRYFKLIDCLTLAFGRSGELKPGDVFPSLKNLPAAQEEDDYDIGPDPRDTRHMFSQMNAGRIIREKPGSS